MSVAFTKEDSAETASETLLPDRPVSPHPNLVTEAGLKALELQLQQAREACETARFGACSSRQVPCDQDCATNRLSSGEAS